MERYPITPQGKEKMETELNRLKRVERPRITKAIEEARAHGDLSENAEYHAAREEQGQVEARIRDYEDKLSRAEVIQPPAGDVVSVIFGVSVTMIDVDSEIEVTYRLVSEFEANPSEGLISITSPVARALVGKELGDEVVVRAPGGSRTYEIIVIKL